jgi:hypothetical protein
MNIEEIKEKVEQAIEDKQEFADLCFKLVPQLISEIERLQDKEWFLSCLNACGVDNWGGYSDACEMYESEEE